MLVVCFMVTSSLAAAIHLVRSPNPGEPIVFLQLVAYTCSFTHFISLTNSTLSYVAGPKGSHVLLDAIMRCALRLLFPGSQSVDTAKA